MHLFAALSATIVLQSGEDANWVTRSMDQYPSISPDGQTLVFHSTRLGAPTLFLSDARGRNVRLIPGDGVRTTPVWSPDGAWIAYAGMVEGQREIFVMRPDGSDVRRLTHSPEGEAHPHWSADGQRLFYNVERSTSEGEMSDIFSMRVDGTDVHRHIDCGGVCTFPVPSPDGRHILFRREVRAPGVSWILTSSETNSEIVVADMDGANERTLSNHAGFDGWPAWSADGRWIAFASSRAGPAFVGHIYLVRPDGSDLRQVSSGGWSHAQPAFAPDGRSLYVYKLRQGHDFEYGFIARVNLPPD